MAVIDAARTLLGYADANSTEFQPATPHPAVVFMPEGSRTHKGGTMRLGARRTVLQTVDCIAAKLYQRENHIDERHRHRYEARCTTQRSAAQRRPRAPLALSPLSSKTSMWLWFWCTGSPHSNAPKCTQMHPSAPASNPQVNPEMVPELEEVGCRFVGRDETGQRMEIMEFAARADNPASCAVLRSSRLVWHRPRAVAVHAGSVVFESLLSRHFFAQGHPYYFAVQYHPEFKSRPGKPSPPFLGAACSEFLFRLTFAGRLSVRSPASAQREGRCAFGLTGAGAARCALAGLILAAKGQLNSYFQGTLLPASPARKSANGSTSSTGAA